MSKWHWLFSQLTRKLWFRACLFALLAVISALVSIVIKPFIPASIGGMVGADAVDNILNILASSMLAVTTFSLNIMVSAYSSATTSVTPRATRLVMEDSTTQNVLATFIGSFLFSLVGIVALSMGAYGERGRVVLFVVTLLVIALIVITLLRWIQHLSLLGRVGETTSRVEEAARNALENRVNIPYMGAKRGYPLSTLLRMPSRSIRQKLGIFSILICRCWMTGCKKLKGSFIWPARPAPLCIRGILWAGSLHQILTSRRQHYWLPSPSERSARLIRILALALLCWRRSPPARCRRPLTILARRLMLSAAR
ncbi:Predicted membrane protein (DUF2254) [Serratia rubidaea]|nr:Predicted membrane protein (DUF2254) [Serratia rubidaea]